MCVCVLRQQIEGFREEEEYVTQSYRGFLTCHQTVYIQSERLQKTNDTAEIQITDKTTR